MRLKSFYSSSVQEAMQQARRELGQDALLLDTRTAPAHARHLGQYEVVFALGEGTGGAPAPGASQTSEVPVPPVSTVSSTDTSQLSSDLETLRREMERLNESVARSRVLSAVVGGALADPDLARLYAELTAVDVATDVAQELVADCARALSAANTTRARATLLQGVAADKLRSILRVTTPHHSPDRQKAIAFVGPTGSGKTSSLVKLAARFGLRSRSPMHIVSYDGLRIAASEQLRALAAILGASFHLVDNPESLLQTAHQRQSRGWIWIDTPGTGPQETDVADEIAVALRKQNGVEIYLVLSATMKSADLRAAVERHARCQPDKVIFTHVDETETYGGLISVAAWLGKPIAFFGTGQRIPEDLESASADRIINRILPTTDYATPSVRHLSRTRSSRADGAAGGV